LLLAIGALRADIETYDFTRAPDLAALTATELH
jgi:hypothetical protein